MGKDLEKLSNLQRSEEAMKVHMVDSLLAVDSKIIGHNEMVGFYNYEIIGTPDHSKQVVGMSKFERDRTKGGENFMRFSFAAFLIKSLMGEVLTTLEASIADERQLKAVKSIVKNYFGRKLDWMYENCGLPEEEQHGFIDPEDE